MPELTCLEICAGAGGQSLGLEQAGFSHVAAVDNDPDACATLRLNRPGWDVIQLDVRHFKGVDYRGVDLLAGGVPCPPFSIAGKQLGADDERDLFPQALRLVEECEPAAVMLENVRGLATARFAAYRERVIARLRELGYEADWQVLNASEYGVPQLRPRFILVAARPGAAGALRVAGRDRDAAHRRRDPPRPHGRRRLDRAGAWAWQANGIGPTLVGGSRKHGGPDLGPTRAREAWLRLRVDGRGLADAPPRAINPPNHIPRLTLPMAAALQGFPRDWRFAGRKTAGYRQIGNAFPPPVARAVGTSIRSAIEAARAAPVRLLYEAS